LRGPDIRRGLDPRNSTLPRSCASSLPGLSTQLNSGTTGGNLPIPASLRGAEKGKSAAKLTFFAAFAAKQENFAAKGRGLRCIRSRYNLHATQRKQRRTRDLKLLRQPLLPRSRRPSTRIRRQPHRTAGAPPRSPDTVGIRPHDGGRMARRPLRLPKPAPEPPDANRCVAGLKPCRPCNARRLPAAFRKRYSAVRSRFATLLCTRATLPCLRQRVPKVRQRCLKLRSVARNLRSVARKHGCVAPIFRSVALGHGSVARKDGCVAGSFGSVARERGSVAGAFRSVAGRRLRVAGRRGSVARKDGAWQGASAALRASLAAQPVSAGAPPEPSAAWREGFGPLSEGAAALQKSLAA